MTKRRALLGFILLLAVFLRLAAALALGDQVVELPGTADQISYHTLALRVLEGHGFSFGQPWWPATAADAPTAHWSFLYVFYLVGVYALVGAHPLAARLIQALMVGIVQPLLAYRLGKRCFGPAAGLAAAAATAVYSYFIYYSATLLTEPFYICAILACLDLLLTLSACQPRAEQSAWRIRLNWLWLGLAIGLAAGAAVLLRQLFLLLLPFLFAWALWGGARPGWRGRLAALALAGLVVVALVVPFTLYNYGRFHRFVLLNTNAGYAFFWANHPIYGTQFQPILPAEEYHDLLPPELLGLDEAALDQALLRRGIQFVTQDPRRYIRLSLSRIPPFFMFWPAPESGLVSNLARLAGYALFLPFMLAGTGLALLSRKRAGWRTVLAAPETLLLLFGLIYIGIHVLIWTLIRYRLPVDAAWMVYAGLALVELGRRLPLRLGKLDWSGERA